MSLGCATPTTPPGVSYHATQGGVTFETLDQPFDLAQIQAIGREIYELDKAAALAWDQVVASGLADTMSATGYLPTRTNSGYSVVYVNESASIVAEVSLDSEFQSPVAHQSARPLSGLQGQLWRAREAALQEPFRACTSNYNALVVASPLESRPGWLVYLLAASSDPDLVILGGHHRVWVSPEFVVDAAEPLSRGCPITKRDPTAVSQAISNFGIERPLETHVFTSLLYSLHMSVFNADHSWEIEQGTIRQTE